MTFLDIYEITMEKCRIVAFQIPPAMPGIPTTWNGAAWAREHESLVPLPMNKVDLIRSQVGLDWSKEIVNEATIEDLDPEAVAYARKMFFQKQENRKQAKEIISSLSDIEVLNKAGICFKGKITRTALLLLGKKESAFYFDGFIPRITWTLYNADKTVRPINPTFIFSPFCPIRANPDKMPDQGNPFAIFDPPLPLQSGRNNHILHHSAYRYTALMIIFYGIPVYRSTIILFFFFTKFQELTC